MRKVLELGADVNMRGETDEQSALNVCLKRIAMIKDPKAFWLEQMDMEMTPEVLDSIRRHNPGMSGFSLSHQASFIANQNSNPEFIKILNMTVELQIERVTENMNLVSLREIASVLIDAGANVNAEHISPVKSYTLFWSSPTGHFPKGMFKFNWRLIKIS